MIELIQNMIVCYKGVVGTCVYDYKNEHIYKFLPISQSTYNLNSLEIIDIDKVKEATEKQKEYHMRAKFSWGAIVKIHKINTYQIVEYYNKREKINTYSIYINYQSTGRGSDTLDGALISAIAHNRKIDGVISCVCKLLDIV